MLLIWKGRGILTPIYLILNLAIVFKLTDSFKSNHSTVLLLGGAFIISGLLSYFTSRTYMEINGEKVRISGRHSFFFIPMKVWSIVFYILGGLLTALGIHYYINF